MKLVKELWDYREMIISLVRRDLKSRYKGSVLGVLWMFVDPLLQIIVYSLVFSTIMKSGIEKFYLFLCVALIPWIFFSTCLSAGTGIILGQQDMVKKIHFPREVLPISFTTSYFVNMVISFIVIFVTVFVSGIGVNLIALLFLPLVMVIEYMLALGITLLSSALTVYFRDLKHIFDVIALAWMYLTPVLYPIEWIPSEYRFLFSLNPMTPIITAYRDILYYKQLPEFSTLSQAFMLSFLILLIGLISFGKLQKHFAEEL